MKMLMKHQVTANRAVDLSGYGKVPMYMTIVQLLGTGEATPEPARIVISVEIGGFGLVMYAAGLVQALSPMTALHTAIEASEDLAHHLTEAFQYEFANPGRSALRTIQVKHGVTFSIAMHGAPEPAPELEAGQQRMAEAS